MGRLCCVNIKRSTDSSTNCFVPTGLDFALQIFDRCLVPHGTSCPDGSAVPKGLNNGGTSFVVRSSPVGTEHGSGIFGRSFGNFCKALSSTCNGRQLDKFQIKSKEARTPVRSLPRCSRCRCEEVRWYIKA